MGQKPIRNKSSRNQVRPRMDMYESDHAYIAALVGQGEYKTNRDALADIIYVYRKTTGDVNRNLQCNERTIASRRLSASLLELALAITNLKKLMLLKSKLDYDKCLAIVSRLESKVLEK